MASRIVREIAEDGSRRLRALLRRDAVTLLLGLAAASAEMTAAQTRVEFHLLPATTTGPMDPDWSPDGQWIAFSMRGDIWKIPAQGGEAIALTAGPDYHFEPDWSPDGRSLAVVVESEGRHDLAWIPADGLPPGARALRLTDDAALDLQPDWSPDGTALFFTRRSGGDLGIYRLAVEQRTDGTAHPIAEPHPFVAQPGHQFFPAVSPDGSTLAWVGRLEGKVGSGVVWTRPLLDPDAEPRLLIDEETSYRTAPRWSADGSALLYSTDDTGSSDIALVSLRGGQRILLTEEPHDEFAPAPSPDGTEIVFVSNHEGPARLYRLSTAGGVRRDWRATPIRTRIPRSPVGRLNGHVRGRGSQPLPARLVVVASDGRAYTENDGFLRRFWIHDTHYSHVESDFELELPEGPTRVLAMRGFEYLPAEVTTEIVAETTAQVTLELERLIDMPARGWYSGDTHSHDLHEGRQGLTQEEFFRFSRADDLHVTNALIHMDGTKLMGRWADLTGEPFPGSDEQYILYYSQEFRGSFGHVALLGLERFVMPLIGGASGTPFAEDVLKLDHLEAVRRQGGIGGYVHPYNGPTSTPQEAAAADIAVHVALGAGEFYDVISIASQEWPSVAMYYRFLNCGFPLAATGGTDNFSDAYRDPSPGTARTYAYLPDGLSYPGWLEAIRESRTFATSGPLLELTVAGERPGSTIDRTAADSRELPFELEVASLFPLDSVEIVVNGRVVQRFEAPGAPRRWSFAGTLDLPAGGWVAARAVGPPHPLVGDDFPFAHTSPVWVTHDGEPYRSPADARFLLETIDALWQRVESRDRFRNDDSRRRYRETLDRARMVLSRIAGGENPRP